MQHPQVITKKNNKQSIKETIPSQQFGHTKEATNQKEDP